MSPPLPETGLGMNTVCHAANGSLPALRKYYELAHLVYLESPLYELIREAYADDDDLAGQVEALSAPNKTVELTARQRSRLHRYSVVEGLLYYQVDGGDEPRIVVPNDEDLRHRVLYEAHDTCGEARATSHFSTAKLGVGVLSAMVVVIPFSMPIHALTSPLFRDEYFSEGWFNLTTFMAVATALLVSGFVAMPHVARLSCVTTRLLCREVFSTIYTRDYVPSAPQEPLDSTLPSYGTTQPTCQAGRFASSAPLKKGPWPFDRSWGSPISVAYTGPAHGPPSSSGASRRTFRP
ncbi:hypothetical protein PR001_g7291 [Phytophthora rubi]|uniref:Uncharacterized protein n=2 Tax=Phytophthora rubi TaxID=129364 RepID=A0A6A3N6T0_9STRA|nr:hypothetical protein PR001_g7291 [Phytophthora rubi]